MKKIILFLFLPLITFAQWNQVGQDIDGEFADDISGTSISINSDGTIIAVGAPQNDGNGSGSGHVRIYENNGNMWVQVGNDIDGVSNAHSSGRSISLSDDGNIVAIGAPLFGVSGNPSAGHVRIFENIGGNWTQIGEDIIGEASNDQFGVSVSLNAEGTILAAGSERNDNTNGGNAGHVRIYENIGGVWTQMGSDIDGEDQGDQSGSSVSLNAAGNIVAIGAEQNDGANGFDTGHVRVFEFVGGNWQQLGSDIEGEAMSDQSGRSISINDNGTIVAIGASLNDNTNGNNAGNARIFEFDGGDWQQVGANINGDAEDDFFGAAISLNSAGNIVAISAPTNDDAAFNAGHVKVFELIAGEWVQIDGTIVGEANDDSFGSAISINSSGSTLAIGARFNDGANGVNSGHARVFRNDLLSLNEVPLEPLVSLYPNPSTNNNSKLLFRKTYRSVSLAIYDSQGKLVSTDRQENTKQIKLNTSDLANGLYLVRVNADNLGLDHKLIVAN